MLEVSTVLADTLHVPSTSLAVIIDTGDRPFTLLQNSLAVHLSKIL